MIGWISKTMRSKNEVFICPYCRNEVRFTDGLARKGDGRIAQCGYIYCPYCAEQIIEKMDKPLTN